MTLHNNSATLISCLTNSTRNPLNLSQTQQSAVDAKANCGDSNWVSARRVKRSQRAHNDSTVRRGAVSTHPLRFCCRCFLAANETCWQSAFQLYFSNMWMYVCARVWVYIVYMLVAHMVIIWCLVKCAAANNALTDPPNMRLLRKSTMVRARVSERKRKRAVVIARCLVTAAAARIFTRLVDHRNTYERSTSAHIHTPTCCVMKGASIWKWLLCDNMRVHV